MSATLSVCLSVCLSFKRIGNANLNVSSREKERAEVGTERTKGRVLWKLKLACVRVSHRRRVRVSVNFLRGLIDGPSWEGGEQEADYKQSPEESELALQEPCADEAALESCQQNTTMSVPRCSRLERPPTRPLWVRSPFQTVTSPASPQLGCGFETRRRENKKEEETTRLEPSRR